MNRSEVGKLGYIKSKQSIEENYKEFLFITRF